MAWPDKLNDIKSLEWTIKYNFKVILILLGKRTGFTKPNPVHYVCMLYRDV